MFGRSGTAVDNMWKTLRVKIYLTHAKLKALRPKMLRASVCYHHVEYSPNSTGRHIGAVFLIVL